MSIILNRVAFSVIFMIATTCISQIAMAKGGTVWSSVVTQESDTNTGPSEATYVGGQTTILSVLFTAQWENHSGNDRTGKYTIVWYDENSNPVGTPLTGTEIVTAQDSKVVHPIGSIVAVNNQNSSMWVDITVEFVDTAGGFDDSDASATSFVAE